LEVIQNLFCFTIKEAAAHIGMSATTLKRICREKGIQRWPSQKTSSAQTKSNLLDGLDSPQSDSIASNTLANYPSSPDQFDVHKTNIVRDCSIPETSMVDSSGQIPYYKDSVAPQQLDPCFNCNSNKSESSRSWSLLNVQESAPGGLAEPIQTFIGSEDASMDTDAVQPGIGMNFMQLHNERRSMDFHNFGSPNSISSLMLPGSFEDCMQSLLPSERNPGSIGRSLSDPKVTFCHVESSGSVRLYPTTGTPRALFLNELSYLSPRPSEREANPMNNDAVEVVEQFTEAQLTFELEECN